MQLLVVQHDHASPLGPVADRFEERGYAPTLHLVVPEERFHAPGVDAAFPDFTDYDAVVLMGAPWSTYDDQVASWVGPEQECLREADEAGVPVLGICFGGQLLAATLGGAVVRSERPEIGWTDVRSDDEALVPSGTWFQWHFDRWRLPTEAREVARNAAASQAFVLRRSLAVQFHPELTGPMLAGWLANGGATQLGEVGIDPEQLTESTRLSEAQAHRRAHLLVDGFLDRVATRPLQRTGTR